MRLARKIEKEMVLFYHHKQDIPVFLQKSKLFSKTRLLFLSSSAIIHIKRSVKYD